MSLYMFNERSERVAESMHMSISTYMV